VTELPEPVQPQVVSEPPSGETTPTGPVSEPSAAETTSPEEAIVPPPPPPLGEPVDPTEAGVPPPPPPPDEGSEAPPPPADAQTPPEDGAGDDTESEKQPEQPVPLPYGGGVPPPDAPPGDVGDWVERTVGPGKDDQGNVEQGPLSGEDATELSGLVSGERNEATLSTDLGGLAGAVVKPDDIVPLPGGEPGIGINLTPIHQVRITVDANGHLEGSIPKLPDSANNTIFFMSGADVNEALANGDDAIAAINGALDQTGRVVTGIEIVGEGDAKSIRITTAPKS
jgi:hypothetical protein